MTTLTKKCWFLIHLHFVWVSTTLPQEGQASRKALTSRDQQNDWAENVQFKFEQLPTEYWLPSCAGTLVAFLALFLQIENKMPNSVVYDNCLEFKSAYHYIGLWSTLIDQIYSKPRQYVLPNNTIVAETTATAALALFPRNLQQRSSSVGTRARVEKLRWTLFTSLLLSIVYNLSCFECDHVIKTFLTKSKVLLLPVETKMSWTMLCLYRPIPSVFRRHHYTTTTTSGIPYICESCFSDTLCVDFIFIFS